jgi:GNAT superfamily N-acetyltransferase
MITKITFSTIYPIWSNLLWPNRVSKIEPTSAMVYLGGYSLDNMNSMPTFFGYYIDNNLVGVNSGHLCSDKGYRSRGLFVLPKYRKLGIGQKLLLATIEQATVEQCDYVWSYPKQSSWQTYKNSGFELSSIWETSENDINAYCILKI